MTITVVRLHEWLGFCKAVDLPAFAADERFRTTQGRYDHADEINACCGRCSRRSRSHTGRSGWPPNASCMSS